MVRVTLPKCHRVFKGQLIMKAEELAPGLGYD